MNSNAKWVTTTIILTFFLALVFGGVSNVLVEKINIYLAALILILIVAIGIAFDMIGMAVATCDEAQFHARAAKKQKGAKESIRILKNREKNTNICNDLMGDICGIISGSISALIALRLASLINIDITIVSLVLGAIIAAITVGGKAMGKTIAVKKAGNIIYGVGKIMAVINPVKDKNKIK